jgi:hypothetical protein
MFVKPDMLGKIVEEYRKIIGKTIQIEQDFFRVDVVELPGQRLLELIVYQKKERGFCFAPFIQFLRKIPGRVFQAKSGIIRLSEQLANLQSSETNS